MISLRLNMVILSIKLAENMSCYRIGKRANVCARIPTLHRVEVLSLKKVTPARRSNHTIAQFLKGEMSEQGWCLHRAFVNAGKIQKGFIIRKYLGSFNDKKQVTSKRNTTPISLTKTMLCFFN